MLFVYTFSFHVCLPILAWLHEEEKGNWTLPGRNPAGVRDHPPARGLNLVSGLGTFFAGLYLRSRYMPLAQLSSGPNDGGCCLQIASRAPVNWPSSMMGGTLG